MKLSTLLSFLLICTFSLFSHAQIKDAYYKQDYPEITFKKEYQEMGVLQEGDNVSIYYEFTNTGKAPLLIKEIKSSCGCTIPKDWSKTPILPGESSEFTILFDSNGRIHYQVKEITILCNTKEGRESVSFSVDVLPNPVMEKFREEEKKRQIELKEKRKNRK